VVYLRVEGGGVTRHLLAAGAEERRRRRRGAPALGCDREVTWRLGRETRAADVANLHITPVLVR
jgi:hypothetical protein